MKLVSLYIDKWELTPGLMITASHQTFSGQLWHLTNQTKFDQTNLLCIINEEVNKFTIGKQMSGQFSTLIISTVTLPICNAPSDWPRTFFTPRVFLFSIALTLSRVRWIALTLHV